MNDSTGTKEMVEASSLPQREPGASRYGKLLRIAGKKTLYMGIGVVVLAVAPVPRAHGQFGIDTAAIIAGLTTLNDTMQAVLQAPMQLLQQAQQDDENFNENVVYPASSITAAQSSATQSYASAQQSQQLVDQSLNSAQLAASQQLESAILSRDPNQVPNIPGLYTQVFGPLPTTAQASTAVTTAIDMGDAASMESLKKSIVLDALADREMEVSQQLLNQLQTAAPGNASLVSAQAAAWILQGHGYTQSAMAQTLRAQGAELAFSGSAMKTGAVTGQSNYNSIFSVPLSNTGSTSSTGVLPAVRTHP